MLVPEGGLVKGDGDLFVDGNNRSTTPCPPKVNTFFILRPRNRWFFNACLFVFFCLQVRLWCVFCVGIAMLRISRRLVLGEVARSPPCPHFPPHDPLCCATAVFFDRRYYRTHLCLLYTLTATTITPPPLPSSTSPKSNPPDLVRSNGVFLRLLGVGVPMLESDR